jgi:hypothetical protein
MNQKKMFAEDNATGLTRGLCMDGEWERAFEVEITLNPQAKQKAQPAGDSFGRRHSQAGRARSPRRPAASGRIPRRPKRHRRGSEACPMTADGDAQS